MQNVGTAIHPSYVEGQFQGGAAQDIGWALNEGSVARVVLTYSFARQSARGQTEIEVPGRTVRQLIRAMEARFPGIERSLEHDVAVLIDCVLHQSAYLQEVGGTAEVAFIPPIAGG